MPFVRAQGLYWISTLCALTLSENHRGSDGFAIIPALSQPKRRKLFLQWTTTDDPYQNRIMIVESRVTTRSLVTPSLLSASTHPNENSSNQNNNLDDSNNNNSLFHVFVQWLAKLSLEDYQWRMNVYKTHQAERMLEESLARMLGENATYVRPMDAGPTIIGPLGRWELESVTWLSRVLDEEGRRAQSIIQSAGKLIRPSENLDAEQRRGPLGYIEQQVVEFWAQIFRAENERARTKTLRPKDLDETFRGPLGQLELEAVRTLAEIRDSETLRGEQIRKRGGAMVRPIDVPGPLGELELKVAEIFRAETRRARERATNRGRIVRPKDAAWRGPLGAAEATAFETIQSLSSEEMERLRSIQKVLQENRPMDKNRESLLGAAEALFVGILRAPKLLMGVIARVMELLQMDETDRELLREKGEAEESSSDKQGHNDM